MAKTVAVSFEESNIKIVKASLSDNSCSVERTEIVEYDEFDTYLQNEKASEFVVTYDFKEAYHGFLSIPILKPKYQQTVIESELRKKVKLNDISFICVPVEDRLVNKRKVMEIFYFAVSNEVIQDVVGRFYDNDKVVKAIFPTVFSAAALIHSESPDKANMGVFGTGQEKIVFFTKEKGVTFIRNYESLDAELSDFDIQNINMTISYCWQNIKINPSSVMILGNLNSACNINTMPTAPIACLYQGERISCSGEQFHNFFLPIASLFTSGNSNILSQNFKNINMTKSYMAYAVNVFIILAICGVGFLLYKGKEALSLKSQIETSISHGSDVESVYTEYDQRAEYMRNIRPVIDFLNRPSADIQKLLEGLAEISAENLRFTSVQAGSKDGMAYSVTINGMSPVKTFSSLQSSFSAMINDLNKMEGISINNKSLNLEHKTFKVELTYRKTQ